MTQKKRPTPLFGDRDQRDDIVFELAGVMRLLLIIVGVVICNPVLCSRLV